MNERISSSGGGTGLEQKSKLLSQRLNMSTFSSSGTDILLSPVVADLHNSISKLCEGWWAREGEEEAEELVPHTLLYLVARTLADGATVSERGRSIVALFSQPTCTRVHVPYQSDVWESLSMWRVKRR